MEQLKAWVAAKDMDNACRSPEVVALIDYLEREHHSYPQVIVNVDEN